jgi:hypothetical protein
MQGMRPSYKTIADFRKSNLEALKRVNRDFLEVCKEFGLFGGELVGIDSSFFRGNVSKRHIYTEKQLKKALDRLEKQIETYLQEMDKADEEEANQEENDTSLQEKLEALKERQQKHKERLSKLRESEEKQISEVDEDARLLYKSGQAVAGYNVQIAVDERHKLLVVCEVTNEGNDRRQLLPMARKARQRLETDTLEVVTDGGYFNPLQIKACVEEGITPFVPYQAFDARTRAQGRFAQKEFQYHAEQDFYTCPEGHRLNLRSTYMSNGKRISRYGSQKAICAQCKRKDECLPDKTPFRQINRWEHEQFLKLHQERMIQQGNEKSRLRAAITEHPFGTLKQHSGRTHFLLRGAQKVSAEMDLMMLSYNFKRVLNILGIEAFRTYCLQRVKSKSGDTKDQHLDLSFATFISRLSQTMAIIPSFSIQPLFGKQKLPFCAFS